MRREKKITIKKGLSETAYAAALTTLILLCVFFGYLGFQSYQQKNAIGAVAAPVAVPEAAAPPSAIGGGIPADAFVNYQQLSDPCLVLVNDDVPLPADWTVTPAMIGEEQVDIKMYQNLSSLISAAEAEEIWIWLASGYRSVEDQEIILNRGIQGRIDEGMGEEAARKDALRTIARPGYSEHHTGLAIDINDVSDNFEDSDAYRWLSQHAAEYGFVQRYKGKKAEITGIDRESWHYRYVGIENAKAMEEMDMCLEEYVLYLKKQGAN